MKDCPDRHPTICKWLKSRYGCKRAEECDYLHVTLASDEVERWEHKIIQQSREYACDSCTSSFSDRRCARAGLYLIKMDSCGQMCKWMDRKSRRTNKIHTNFIT